MNPYPINRDSIFHPIGNPKSEFRFVVNATMNASKLPVVVMENADTSEFTVIPLDEFTRVYVRASNPTKRVFR